MAAFTIDGKNYELKYNFKRIEIIESQTSMPTLAQIRLTQGYFGVSDLKIYIASGLKEEGADIFVMPKKATEIAEQLITTDYSSACAAVLEALERDCPFFFREG